MFVFFVCCFFVIIQYCCFIILCFCTCDVCLVVTKDPPKKEHGQKPELSRSEDDLLDNGFQDFQLLIGPI